MWLVGTQCPKLWWLGPKCIPKLVCAAWALILPMPTSLSYPLGWAGARVELLSSSLANGIVSLTTVKIA